MTTKTVIQKSKIVCPKCGAIYNRGKLEGYYTTAVYRWLQKGYVQELCQNCEGEVVKMRIRYATNHITMTVSNDQYATMLYALRFSLGGVGFVDYEPIALYIIDHCEKSWEANKNRGRKLK